MGGGSPSDKPGQNQSQSQKQQQGGQKESTPESPEGQGDKKEPQQKPGEQPQGAPKSPEASPEQNPENRAGDAPPTEDGERVRYVDDIERWGHLPVHVQEVFRSEGGGTLPPQYRDWIEGYYKRLNRAP